MKKVLVITDVTRMREGRVCIAGYDQEGRCIRPVLPPPGIHESALYAYGHVIVFPFAEVEYELLHSTPEPPHTEDYRYDPASVRFVGQVSEETRKEVLTKSLFPSLEAVFEVPVCTDPGHYVVAGKGPRSLGTIRPARILKAIYEQSEEGSWKYRLGFVDGEDKTYWLTVNDLTWRYYNDRGRTMGIDPKAMSSRLTSALKRRDVYLRVGLTRGWEKFPDRCYIQVTGIYTFPDCLKGRTFADFAPVADAVSP